jgi:parvulin-like peptidyl-prolyl isomerase
MMLAVMPGWSGAADSDIVFATVGDIEISRAEFEREVYTAARGTFYHGRVPEEDEFIEFRKGIAQQLIDRKLLIAEARQRELQPDDAGIEARLALYEDQYGETERWQVEGEQMIATLRAKFEEDSLLEVLEADIRAVSEPDESAARAFYEANPDLFTQPARRRVSLILLAVPPSATADTWGAARDEAARIVTQLEEGESFEDLASLHSSDVSAGAGGDMGFIHEGTLAADAEKAIDALELNEVSAPVRVLEGIAIFKLTGIAPARLHAFDDVRERAIGLWKRQQGDERWEALIASLRSSNEIVVDDAYLTTLPDAAQ